MVLPEATILIKGKYSKDRKDIFVNLMRIIYRLAKANVIPLLSQSQNV